MAVNWELLSRGGPNWAELGQNITRNIEQGQLRGALSAISRGSGDPRAWETLYRLNPAVAMQMQDQQYQNKDRHREGAYRNALAETLIGGGSPLSGGSPATGIGAAPNALLAGMGGPQGHPSPHDSTGTGQPFHPAPGASPGAMNAGKPAGMSARELAIRNDPQAFIRDSHNQAAHLRQQLQLSRELNDFGMQTLASVTDQASYTAGIGRVREMWTRYGQDPSWLDDLPAQWSLEVQRQLQMRGMDTNQQLQNLFREHRLEWDIEDDRIDNDEVERFHDESIRVRERGQDIGSADRRRGQDLTDSRGRRGQDLNDARGRRGQDMADRRARDGVGRQGRGGGAGRGRGRAGGNGAVAVGPDGRRYVVRNGQWVPEQ